MLSLLTVHCPSTRYLTGDFSSPHKALSKVAGWEGVCVDAAISYQSFIALHQRASSPSSTGKISLGPRSFKPNNFEQYVSSRCLPSSPPCTPLQSSCFEC